MALEEDRQTGAWRERSVCMGDTKTCSFPGLINHHHKFIISFAEDEAGELYFLATAYPSATSPYGTVFKFMDPSRRAPPGKCKVKPRLVKVRGKKLPFIPRELTVLDTSAKPTRPPPKKLTKNTIRRPSTTVSTTTARATTTTTATTLKLIWISSDDDIQKKNKYKLWKKKKQLAKVKAQKKSQKLAAKAGNNQPKMSYRKNSRNETISAHMPQGNTLKLKKTPTKTVQRKYNKNSIKSALSGFQNRTRIST